MNSVDFKLGYLKSNSFIGGNYISNKRIKTNLDFICQIELEKGILYFFYDLENNINYDLNNNKRCLVYFEDKWVKREHNINSNIQKRFLNVCNNNFDVRFLGKEESNNFHKENIELLDRRYNLSKGDKPLPFVLEDVKVKCHNWTLLLQINSNEVLNIGDNGTLYFYIRKNDLENFNFNNVYCIKESY